MKKFISYALACVLIFTSNASITRVNAETLYDTPAEFTITNDITNEAVEAFTFTAADGISGSSSPITNQMVNGGGFEPIIYRTRVAVQKDDPNTIYTNESEITAYDTFAQGFLDGGEALVYRPENGELKLIRRSRIKSYNASPKNVCFDNRAVTGTSAKLGWDNWERSCDYYFAVAAMDSTGKLSPLSDWIAVAKKDSYENSGNANSLNNYSSISIDTSSQGALAAPTNLTTSEDAGNKCANLSWNAVDGAAGYVIYKSYYPASEQKGCSIELADHEVPLKNKDMVILRKEFYDWSREKYLTPRVYNSEEGKGEKALSPVLYSDPNNDWSELNPVFGDDAEVNWRLYEHKNVPNTFTNPGKTYMRINLGDDTQKVEYRIYNHAGPNGNNGEANDYYKILEYNHTYRVEFWARTASKGEMTAEVGFNDFYSKLGKKSFTITNEWKKYVAEFTIPEEENTSPWIGQLLVSFKGDNYVDVDALQMYDVETEPNMWFDRDIQAVKDSGFSIYRNHTFIKSGTYTYSMDMLCNPSAAFNKSAAGSATLDSYLKVCRKAGVNPWFQIEMHMAPEEWLGWAEYMCEEYDPAVDSPEEKPYAFKRYQAGQKTPWIDEFDKIIFEISNETWNPMFNPWNFIDTTDSATGKDYNASETYGMYHEFVLDIFRYSKYGKKISEKMESVLGGWAVTEHEVKAGKFTPSATYLTRAAYNGGWDEGTILSNDEQGYFFTSVYGIQKATPDAIDFLGDRKRFADSRPLGTYEAGPGYPLPGYLSDEQKIEHDKQNKVQKSLAGAVSTLDCFLLNAAYYDHDIQNYFTFSRGEMYWTSHASVKDGGQEHLAFKALTMFNNSATGDFVQVDTDSAPTLDIPQVGNRPATESAPMVAAYATKNGNKYNVFVLSRKVNGYPDANDDGYTPVSLNLPFTRVNGVTVQKLTGDPKTTNIDRENISIETEELDITEINSSFVLNEETGAEAKGVGPCSIYLYTFDVDESSIITPEPVPSTEPTEDPNKYNMVINPSFEIVEFGSHWVDASVKFEQGWLNDDITAGTNAFVGATGEISPVSGNKMMAISPLAGDSENDWDRLSQNIDCKNGREYKFSFYTTEGTQPVFRINYACVSTWGHTASCGDTSHEHQTYLTNDNVTKTDMGNGWYKIEGTFTCTNDCGIKILFQPMQDKNITVYYDDVRVEDTHPETIPTEEPVVIVTKPPYGSEDEYREYLTEPPSLYSPTPDPVTPEPSTTTPVTSTPEPATPVPTTVVPTTVAPTPTVDPTTPAPTEDPYVAPEGDVIVNGGFQDLDGEGEGTASTGWEDWNCGVFENGVFTTNAGNGGTVQREAIVDAVPGQKYILKAKVQLVAAETDSQNTGLKLKFNAIGLNPNDETNTIENEKFVVTFDDSMFPEGVGSWIEIEQEVTLQTENECIWNTGDNNDGTTVFEPLMYKFGFWAHDGQYAIDNISLVPVEEEEPEESPTTEPSASPATPYVNGQLIYKVWNDIEGTQVDNLVNNEKYNESADVIGTLDSFISTYTGDKYGMEVSGYIVPKQSGSYTFYIASDDAGQLWLSSSSSTDDLEMIAYHTDWTNVDEFEKHPTQKSETIELVAGQAYAIKALMKEDGGGDNLAVAWEGPGIDGRQVISSEYITYVLSETESTIAPTATPTPEPTPTPTPEVVVGQELVKNGQFSNELSEWTDGYYDTEQKIPLSVETEGGIEDEYIKISSYGWGAGANQKIYGITPGEYTLSFDVKGKYMIWFGPNDWDPAPSNVDNKFGESDEWTHVEITFTTETLANYYTLRLIANGDICLYDNVSLKKLSSTYTVKFANIDNRQVAELDVEKGSAIAKLPTMWRDGYTFLGWKLDGELVDESFIPQGDTTLKASFERKEEVYSLSLGEKWEIKTINDAPFRAGMETNLHVDDTIILGLKDEYQSTEEVDYWKIKGLSSSTDDGWVAHAGKEGEDGQLFEFLMPPTNDLEIDVVTKSIGEEGDRATVVQPAAMITAITRAFNDVTETEKNNGNIRFYAYALRVAGQSEFVDCGVVIYKDESNLEEVPDFDLNTSGIKEIKSSGQGEMGEYAIVRKDSKSKYWIKAYTKYKDSQGQEQIVYTTATPIDMLNE